MFSSTVLDTTSPETPDSLSGGLSFGVRLVITLISFAFVTALAFTARAEAGAFAAAFFLPGLMLAAAFGVELGLGALVAAVAIAATFFTQGNATILFAAIAMLQTALALVMRQLFRESRRWGVRYRRLINAISEATALADAQGRIDRPQPDLGRIVGMPWPEYAGMRWLKAVHPEDQDRLPPRPPHHDLSVHRAEIRVKGADASDWRWYLLRSVPLLGDDGNVAEWISILTDVHERKLAEEQRELTLGEMRHRFKNLMTVIQSMAQSSHMRGDRAVEDFLEKFLGRLNALTVAADEVMINDRIAIEAGAVIRATLAPFMEENSERILLDGPACFLSEATGGALALGIHELATNAIKYGSLSVPSGTVRVTWNCRPMDDGEEFTIDWIENGGPPARKPNREGFGSRLIRFVPARERNGAVDLDYTESGLRCRISFLREGPPLRPSVSDWLPPA